MANPASSSTDLSFPIGRFQAPDRITPEMIETATKEIAALPGEVARALAELSAEELEKQYRPGGWTGRQVVAHLADSHMNAFIRFKFALTEDRPTIMPYNQDLWARTPEVGDVDPKAALSILEGLHARLAALLRSLTPEEWARTYVHPESGERRVDTTALLYAWHGKHHVAHLRLLKGA